MTIRFPSTSIIIDIIFVKKKIEESILEHQPLCMCFLNVEKLLTAHFRHACPGKFLNLMLQFYEGVIAKVGHLNHVFRLKKRLLKSAENMTNNVKLRSCRKIFKFKFLII